VYGKHHFVWNTPKEENMWMYRLGSVTLISKTDHKGMTC